jgi:hypothetical protein
MPARPDSGRESLFATPALHLAACDGKSVPATRADPGRRLGRVPAMVLDRERFDVGIPNVARVYDVLLGRCFL